MSIKNHQVHLLTCLMVMLIGFVSLTGCQDSQVVLPEEGLKVFEKVDDYPLYVVVYEGDYFLPNPLVEQARIVSVQAQRDSDWGCSVFTVTNEGGSTFMGRNFDWYERGAMMLFTNPPDRYASVSMVDTHFLGFGTDEPITLDDPRLDYAPHLPIDGMNEAGLVVGMMAIPHADTGYAPERITTNSLEIIRILLDYAGNVEEAIALLGSVNIDFGDGPPIHYMVADPTGRSAVIEFIEGEMMIFEEDHPWQVSTNFNLADVPLGSRREACWRYDTVYGILDKEYRDMTQEDALDVLKSVSQPSGNGAGTQWSVVYDTIEMDLILTLGGKYKKVYTYDLRELTGD